MAKRGLDYYGILGLTKSASDEEIKEAYRHLSLQYNPLRNKDPNLQDLFCLVGEAYEVLTSPLLKAIYDHYGEAGMKKGTLTPVGWHPPWVYHGEPIRTFKKFFGTANPYADLMYCMKDQIAVFKAHKIEDVKVKEQPYERELELTLEEVYRGTMKKFKIERRVFDNEDILRLQEKIICVHIKPGLPSGTKIVFQNVGDEGPGIHPGDLVIITKDLPHEKFKRNGVNLHMDVTLDLYQSLEKLIVELNTLDDRIIRFAITDVISAGCLKIVHGEGMPYVDDPNTKGDLIIKFDVSMPVYLDDERRKKLIQALLEEDIHTETPEGLYKLWLASKMKRNFVPTKLFDAKPKEDPFDNAEEDHLPPKELPTQVQPQVLSRAAILPQPKAAGQTSLDQLCRDVKINKDSLYKL